MRVVVVGAGSSARRPRGRSRAAASPSTCSTPARSVGQHGRARRGQRAVRGQGRRAGARARGPRPRGLRDRGGVRGARGDPPQGRAGRPPHRGGAGRRARGSSGCARRASSASCSAPRRRAPWSPGSASSSARRGAGDLQCDRARSPARWPRGRHPRAHPRGSTASCPARASSWRASSEPPTTSCSPPGRGAPRAGAHRGLHLPLEPRKGQLVRLAGRLDIRHKVVDGGAPRRRRGPRAGLQVSTVVETTADGQVLVGSAASARASTRASPRPSPSGCWRAPPPSCPAWPRCGRRPPGPGCPWLPDGLPALGRSATGLWVATGHEGAGIGLGPISGELLAAAIGGETPRLDLAPFAPDRFGEPAPPSPAPRRPAPRG